MKKNEFKYILKGKKKIIIIGPNGSGKSTLASKIGEQLKMKVYHLDKIYWKNNWEAISEREFNIRVEEIMSSTTPSIVDGDYFFNLERRLKYADLIIWIKIPLFVCVFNILRRRVKNINSVRFDMADGCQEKLSIAFFIYALKYNRRSGNKTKLLIKNSYNKEIFIINKYKTLKEILKI